MRLSRLRGQPSPYLQARRAGQDQSAFVALPVPGFAPPRSDGTAYLPAFRRSCGAAPVRPTARGRLACRPPGIRRIRAAVAPPRSGPVRAAPVALALQHVGRATGARLARRTCQAAPPAARPRDGTSRLASGLETVSLSVDGRGVSSNDRTSPSGGRDGAGKDRAGPAGRRGAARGHPLRRAT